MKQQAAAGCSRFWEERDFPAGQEQLHRGARRISTCQASGTKGKPAGGATQQHVKGSTQ